MADFLLSFQFIILYGRESLFSMLGSNMELMAVCLNLIKLVTSDVVSLWDWTQELEDNLGLISSKTSPLDHIHKLEASLEDFEKRTQETTEVLAQGLDILSERLPGSFQDITQKEIRGHLERLEVRIDRLENKRDTQQAIILQKWQVWLAVIAIVITVIISVTSALMQWGVI